MPRKGDSPRKQQFIEWLDRQTDPEAWLTKTYQQIGEEMVEGETGEGSHPPVDPSVVRTVLAPVMADRLEIPPSEVRRRKREHRISARGYMTPEKQQRLRHWRTQDPPVPIADCAYRLDVSEQTILNHCQKMGLDADRFSDADES